MPVNLSNILVFFLVGFGFVLVTLLIGRMVRPSVPTAEKLTTYECGEPVVGSGWINFNMRFYLIALLFIIFDVEIAFMLPVAVVFKEWVQNGQGWLALAEFGLFAGILLLGLIYIWVHGDLEWVKKLAVSKGSEVTSPEVVEEQEAA